MTNFLREVSEELKAINDVSNKLMMTTVSYLKELDSESGSFLSYVKQKSPIMSITDIIETLKRLLTPIVNKVKKVSNEISPFEKSFANHKCDLLETCPFLSEVWSGDAYDASGIEGLRSLRRDLQENLSKVTDKSLMATLVIRS